VTWHTLDAVRVAGSNRSGAGRGAAMSMGAVLLAAGDPRSTRIVYASVIALVVIGVMFAVLGVWLLRQTRVDPEMLAPLERMGDGDWRKRDPATQRRMLDEVRPEGAQPLHLEPKPPEIDAEFEQSDRPLRSFDDLAPPLPDEREPTPAGGLSTPVGDRQQAAGDADGDDDGSGGGEPEDG
jgi:hypothetical protein